AESWWLLDNYARARTSQCLYIDTDNMLNACKADDAVTVWNFNNPEQGFSSDVGPATLSFYDPEDKNWGPEDSQFATTTELEIADLPTGASGVLAFARHSPTQGLTLTANSAA
ncbi:metallophosphatase, partial [Pseudoalteromonas sp. 2102]|nr:metallophosphatase [Pseudoalteromonas sp. 2102]